MSSRLLRFIVLIMTLLALPFSVFAASGALPAVASLPLVSPLKSPLATPSPIPGSISASTPLAKQDKTGASIQLNLANASRFIGAMAVVQWQDSQQQWLDVPGWRSMLGARVSRWWVSPRDFGAGPFRWIILRDKTIIAQSQPFTLPKKAGITLTIRAA